jgi:hypothetical protein
MAVLADCLPILGLKDWGGSCDFAPIKASLWPEQPTVIFAPIETNLSLSTLRQNVFHQLFRRTIILMFNV